MTMQTFKSIVVFKSNHFNPEIQLSLLHALIANKVQIAILPVRRVGKQIFTAKSSDFN